MNLRVLKKGNSNTFLPQTLYPSLMLVKGFNIKFLIGNGQTYPCKIITDKLYTLVWVVF